MATRLRAAGRVGPRAGALEGALAVLAVLAAAAGPLRAQGSQTIVQCRLCHGDRAFLEARVSSPDFAQRLYVTDSLLQDTRHSSLKCATCHPDFGEGYPHRFTTKAVPCQSCHELEGREWAASIHAANAAAVGDAPTCTGCHGTHTIHGADDRRSPTYPLNVAALCGRCHADPRIIGTYFMAPSQAQARVAVPQYYQTVHGMALTKAGLVVSATCNDCHRAHEVLPASSPASSVNRAHIPETCGACHAGVLDVYAASAHGRARATGGPNGHGAPVCTDCHSGHKIVRADQPAWLSGVVEECGTCHEKLYETYFDTYHGKVTRLGSGLAAKCSDCHTAHDMLPATDPTSSVFPANLVATCGKCHPNANENFVRYYPHGDPHDRNRYPVLFWPWLAMTTLLVGVFAFFGLHTVLWLGRSTVDRLRARRSAGGRPGGHATSGAQGP